MPRPSKRSVHDIKLIDSLIPEFETSGNLRQIRNDKRLKAVEVAANLGIHKNALYDWELGKQLASSEMLQKLAQYYGMPIKEILEAQMLSVWQYFYGGKEEVNGNA